MALNASILIFATIGKSAEVKGLNNSPVTSMHLLFSLTSNLTEP